MRSNGQLTNRLWDTEIQAMRLTPTAEGGATTLRLHVLKKLLRLSH